jgi:O-succinylbenzoic acid--CoA ligase
VLVPAWLPRAAAAHPDRPAINAFTYAELLERARAQAPELALRAEGTDDFAVALHARLLRGQNTVPRDPRVVREERELPAESPARTDGLVDLDAPALRLLTSGTTAAPRPVVLTYGNLFWAALGSAAALGLDVQERWLCALPLAHVGGLSILTRSVVYGTSVLLHERFDARRAVTAVMEEGVTLVSVVPTMLARMLDAGLREPPALRWALVGGAPLAPSLRARAEDAGVPVAESYGMTEAASQAVTEGVPLPGVRVELDEDGEIILAGPTIAGGGPLHTGDLGAWDAQGRLRIGGRKADTIITGGENVAPQEVEQVLLAHRDVEDAAVVGRPDPEWGEAVVALVVGGVGEEDLRAWARERLAAHQVPKRVEHVDELPRNAAGKLDRNRLRA